ncbi:MAG: YdcF family protein [Candidatus Omnitrophica bacterium]|nr:YdcF family protein [Candidatus Omnitrophota bacterium]
MLKNQDIICISSIDWDFVWQGHQEIMSTFARNGNRVLFIENIGVRSPNLGDVHRLKKRIVSWIRSTKGFREERKNLFVYSPVILPFPHSKIAGRMNRQLLIEPLKRWMKAISFRDPIIWTFLPTSMALEIIDEFDSRKLLVYYNIADFNVLTDNPKRLRDTENKLIKKCDVIFAQGPAIANKCLKINPNVHIFPFGVNTKVFDDYLSNPAKKIPADISGIHGPIIGYIGGIHKHVDLSLIKRIATSHPKWSVVLVGPKQVDTGEIEGLSNIFMLGKKEFEDLPAYINRFDVCTIPYLVSEYTMTVYPTKLNEYHMMGKPVVSTALPEVEAMNRGNSFTYIAGTHEEFIKFLEKALAFDTADARSGRMNVARNNSWSSRIDRMSAFMEDAIERKGREPSMTWQDKFLKLYKNTKRTMMKSLIAALAFYLLVFYTPIVWVLAQPLIVSDPPKKVDAIVVLGGGIGESGKVGQGYEERAEYAVELYKKGYASYIIFSSGYIHILEETLVMKALALSLGVPENAIVLENRVSNTHDSVLFTREILDKKGWKKIILLTSPYHMLRVSKVFAKMGGDIDVSYTPIPKSSFYAHKTNGIFTKKISLTQIRGIMHEYLGIIYYWFKGWI